jgi:hypothetical protein
MTAVALLVSALLALAGAVTAAPEPPESAPEPDDAAFMAAAARYWPASELPNVWAIDGCESTHGADPRTYSLDAPDGGRLQLNRATWESFFERNHGWPWEQVVRDLDTHLHAAYIVWQRAGGTWAPWSCRIVLAGG